MDIDLLAEGLELEFERRQREEPLRFVELNSAIREFAEAWIDPAKRILVLPAPNGVGKSVGSVVLLGWSIWPETAPEWFRTPWLRKLPSIDKSFRIVSTPEEAGEAGTLQNAIKKYWPKAKYLAVKNRKAFDSFFTCSNGWIGDVMTYEQEIGEFEGSTRGLILYNEPPPREIRKACLYRTRMGGMEAFPMTPLANSAWIKDEIVDAAPTDPSIAVVTCDIEVACKDHGRNGHLPHDRIQELIRQMDPDEVEARAHGKFIHLSGVIFKSFSPKIHVSREPIPVIPVGPKFQVIDPGGYNKPFAIIWGQIAASPMHGKQILREWPDGSAGSASYFERFHSPEMKVEDYAKMFDEVEKELGFRKDQVHRIFDRRFGAVKDLTTGLSLFDQFSRHGYHFVESYGVAEKLPEVKTGIQHVKVHVKVDPLTKQPFLALDPRVVNTRRAFERWAIDPKTQKPRDDAFKNFMDVVRYLCSAGLEYFVRDEDVEMPADASAEGLFTSEQDIPANQPFWGGVL